MEKVDFVNYRALAAEVRQLRSYLGDLERSLLALSSPGSPRSRVPDKAARMARVEEIRQLYAAKVADKMARLLVLEEAVDALEAPAERLVMRLRYFEGRSWPSVCGWLQREGFSERQVYRLHGSALQKLKEA